MHGVCMEYTFYIVHFLLFFFHSLPTSANKINTEVFRMRNSGTYLMLERIIIIQEMIQNEHFPTLVRIQQGIKDRLGSEFSIATLNRDIDFLRTRANCPISYSKQERGYYVDKTCSAYQ